jgi:glycine cleavage system H protein
VRAGFTPIAIELAGDVSGVHPKRVGKPFEAQRSFATIECGKWIGAARAAFRRHSRGGQRGARATAASFLNDDAFGAGWMLLVRAAPTLWRDRLVTGSQIAPAFAAWIAAEAYKGRTE